MSRGKKRPSTSSVLALVEPKTRLEISDGLRYSSALADPSQAPLCRPWDRGDLMRRLATFKSMTWFAKPKVYWKYLFFIFLLSIYEIQVFGSYHGLRIGLQGLYFAHLVTDSV